MTPEQIETLKNMADEQDKTAKDCQETAETYRSPWGDSMRNIWEAKAVLAKANAAALRKAIETMERAEKLPKTADGATVWPGDAVWYCAFDKVFRADIVAVLRGGPTSYYSTKAAAIAAANKAIGGEA